MAILYDMSEHHPVSDNHLAHILEQGEAWAKENNVAPDDLVQKRLAEDMQPLGFQVTFLSNVAKGVQARIAGFEWVTMDDKLTTMAQLKERVQQTLEVVRTAEGKQDAFKGLEDKEVMVWVPGKELKFTALLYVQYWVIPNFYFHLTTAYDILRKEGVALGKKDFLGMP
ncbi:hypothetical protein Q7P37_006371 [Cladosporium fusiforme]